MATGCDIVVPKGDTQKVNVTVQDTDGNAIDLTQTDSVVLTVSETLGHIRDDVVLTVDGDNLQSDGSVEFVVESGDTDGLSTGLYRYEIEVSYSSGDEYTAETSGRFFVEPHANHS